MTHLLGSAGGVAAVTEEGDQPGAAGGLSTSVFMCLGTAPVPPCGRDLHLPGPYSCLFQETRLSPAHSGRNQSAEELQEIPHGEGTRHMLYIELLHVQR